MPKFFFHLGNTPLLSRKELESVLHPNDMVEISSDIVEIDLPENVKVKELINILGGTVKISRFYKKLPYLSEEELTKEIISFLEDSEDKITFALAEIGRDHLPEIEVGRIKSRIEKDGRKARYVDGSRRGLSASVLLHKEKVKEVLVIQTGDGIYLNYTAAVQNIDAWSFRDRGKPYADRRKGMLPPKVALMMVNIALGNRPEFVLSQALENPKRPAPGTVPVVYDPFCGTGTVLMEALLRDCQVVGSDVDPKSAEGSRENLEWLINNLQENPAEVKALAQPLIFHKDVTQVQAQQLRASVDCLVTEPFLGKPTPDDVQLPNIFKGLMKLYWGAFRQWTQLLADGAVIVIVFPYVETQKNTYSLESLIDKIAPLGYTMESEPIMYHRPQAIVQRQIHFLKFKKS